ncbi:MAG: endonuclease domain-containing protein [Patescibacteria group bacterium]
MPEPERRIWFHLKGGQLGIKFRRQFGIGPYIVDFYCREARLAIEIDGDSHFTDDAQRYDAHRTRFIRHTGIDIIRFTNKDIADTMQGVIERIQDRLRKRIRSEPPLTPPS